MDEGRTVRGECGTENGYKIRQGKTQTNLGQLNSTTGMEKQASLVFATCNLPQKLMKLLVT